MRAQKTIRLVADEAAGLEPIEVRPDSRDMYLLRGEVEQRGWPTDMRQDPIRQAYLLAFLAAKRTKQLPPNPKGGGSIGFADFVSTFAMDDTGEDEPDLEVGPTNAAAWPG